MFVGIIFSGCATRVQPITETVPYVSLPEGGPVEVIEPFMDRLHSRIMNNEKGLGKYFRLDENGKIILRADFIDGENEYTVIYDTENAKNLGNSAFAIDFSITEKLTGSRIEDTLVWRPGPGDEGLLLAFDDDYMDKWQQYFSLLDKYECKVTFFIQGNVDPLVTVPFARAAIERGHDVGFHSITHPDLRRVSEQTFMAETVEPQKLYMQHGIHVSSFAYPFGFSETWMHEVLLDTFDVVRGYGVTFRIYNENDIRSGHIISRAIDNTVIQGNENFEKTIMSMLLTVKFLEDSRVLPLTTHDISDTAAWGITAARLEFLLKTASDLGLRFYRYNDFSVR